MYGRKQETVNKQMGPKTGFLVSAKNIPVEHGQVSKLII